MAIALILLEEDPEFSVDAELFDGLAEVGVTGLAVLRAEQAVAVVIEGWSLEGERLTSAADLVAGGHPARVFRPVARMTVTLKEGDRT